MTLTPEQEIEYWRLLQELERVGKELDQALEPHRHNK